MNAYENRNVLNFRFEEDIKNIRLNLLGTGVLYEEPHLHYNLKPNMTWRRPKEISKRPVFINGVPSRYDALQGRVGDCYLASAIGAITLNDQLVKHVVPPDQSFDHDYIGAFHFRIWQLGNWVDVVVDDRLPTYSNEKLCYMHSFGGNVFWAALLEKAYAKFYGTGYDELKTGYALTSFQDLSGGIVEIMNLHDLPPQTTVEWLLKEALSNKTMANFLARKEKDGVRIKHFYTLIKMYKFPEKSYYEGQVIVRLMNPWGSGELGTAWKDGDDRWHNLTGHELWEIGVQWRVDGEFWMSLEDFVSHFDYITLCHLGPGQYLSLHRFISPIEISAWDASISFYGEWVKPFSTGGSAVESRHKNPQYLFQVNIPDKDGKRYVVIELTQRSKLGRTVRPLIACFIYNLKPSKKISMPLKKRFFKNNTPIDKNPNFSSSKGRSYVTSMNLRNGKYCIVPCTQDKNLESNFLLRLFSENRVLRVLPYDDGNDDAMVGKSIFPSIEQVKEEKSDHELRERFDNAARGQDELDCAGLKEVLGDIFTPQNTYSWLFRMVIIFIHAVFGIYVPGNISFIGILINFINAIFQVDIHPMWSDTDCTSFTKNECRSMIAMFDDDHSGKLRFSEFRDLYNKICFWKKVFFQHRDEPEGYLSVARFEEAIGSIGYDVPQRLVHSLSFVYADDDGNISLTDFILCGVTLETLLSLDQKKNLSHGNDTTMTLEDWVRNTLVL